VSSWAKKTADKYIRADGSPPVGGRGITAQDAAEDAWRATAETVHRFLRRKENLEDPEGREALFAFQRIGDAIALQHKRFVTVCTMRDRQ
jgi:hypothetical protein